MKKMKKKKKILRIEFLSLRFEKFKCKVEDCFLLDKTYFN